MCLCAQATRCWVPSRVLPRTSFEAHLSCACLEESASLYSQPTRACSQLCARTVRRSCCSHRRHLVRVDLGAWLCAPGSVRVQLQHEHSLQSIRSLFRLSSFPQSGGPSHPSPPFLHPFSRCHLYASTCICTAKARCIVRRCFCTGCAF